MTRQQRLTDIITNAESVIAKARELKLAAETLKKTMDTAPEEFVENERERIEQQLRKNKSAVDSLTTACQNWLSFRNPPEDPTSRD